MGVGVDYLSVTVPTSTAEALKGVTRHREEGSARPGFGASELRDCLGGTLWRRWQPHQPSREFGSSYESWEASGCESRWLADFVSARRGRPSRVDVAFDFAVSPTIAPDHVWRAVRHHVKRRGIVGGISGEGGKNTRYIGSIHSSRRIRIYRRDWKDPLLREEFRTPLLRVELVLKDDLARNWWAVFERDTQEAYAAAAAHVEQMTGLRLVEDLGSIPEPVEVREELEAAQQVLHFLDQSSGMIVALCDGGMSPDLLLRLARRRQASSSRRSQWVSLRRADTYRRLGMAVIVRAVLLLLRTTGAARAA